MVVDRRKNSQNTLMNMQATLLNLSNEAIFAGYINGAIIYWNKGAEKMYGYSSDEAIGTVSHDLLKTVHPGKIDDIKSILARDEAWNGEVEHTCKDGTKLIIETKKQIILNELGQQVVLEINRNITERKQAEFMINHQNTILNSINQVYEKAFQCENSEELGRACLGIIESITGSKFSFIGEFDINGLFRNIAVSDTGWELCKMIIKSGQFRIPSSYEVRGLCSSVLLNATSVMTNAPSLHPDSIGVPEGHPELTAFLGVPFIRDGIVAGMIAVCNREGGYRKEDQDILEAMTATILETLLRKRAEEKLRQSEKEYRLLFETMLQGVVYQDSEGSIISMNPAAERILGKTSAEFPGSSSVKVEHHTIREDGSKFPGMEHPSMVSLQTGQEIHDVVMGVFNPREEAYRWISINAVPIFQPGEIKPHRVYTIFSDITEGMQNQRLIKNQQDKVLKAEIEKNETLLKSIEMKDEFLSMISHEFKTPITVINSAIQAMEFVCKDELSDKGKGFLNKIRQNTNRQLKLVNNILDITRLSAGRLKVNRKDMDIVFLTKSITESIIIFAEQKNIKMSFSSTLGKKVIGIDEEKYERVLLNLLSNAVKFTPKGKSVFVRVSQKVVKGKCMVCIQVRDKGVGIPDDKKDLIFERFGQVDSSLTRQAEGTGIGLHLVKMLVKMMGGEITLESKVGVGSTFTILLPTQKVKDTPIEQMLKDIADNRLIQATAIEFSDIYM